MFDLNNVVNAAEVWMPQRILLYGVPGLGKSTFGSTFDKPILARTEDGAGTIDIPTFPNLIKSYQDMCNVVDTLHGEHNFKTLIIDSLDWLEPIVWAYQILIRPNTEKGKKVKTIEDYGFGKGYHMSLDLWRYLMQGFDSLRNQKGIEIVLIAHADIKRYDSPDSEPYDRYQAKLHKSAFALWREWADMMLFLNFKTHVESTDVGFNKEVKRGTGSGDRVVYTEERPAFLAKNRLSLPPEILIGQDKNWSAFHQAVNECSNGRYQLPESLTKAATEQQSNQQ